MSITVVNITVFVQHLLMFCILETAKKKNQTMIKLATTHRYVMKEIVLDKIRT